MSLFKTLPLFNFWPLQRKDLLIFLLNNKYEEISRIWTTVGHIFVLLRNGSQNDIVTFDVKPAGLNKDAGDLGCLDLSTNVHIIDLLYLKSNSTALVIDEKGHIDAWKYNREENVWMSKSEHDLCTVSQSRLVSVCHNNSEIFWCEERTTSLGFSSYCICKRPINLVSNSIQLGTALALLHTCPMSIVYSIGSDLYIFSSTQSTSFSGIRINVQRTSLDILSGNDFIPYDFNPSDKLDFSSVILASVHKLYQEEGSSVVATLYDGAASGVMVIREDGSLISFHDNNSGQPVNSIMLEGFKHVPYTQYYICLDLLVSAREDGLRFYNKFTGSLLNETSWPLPLKIAQPIVSHSPIFPIFVDECGLYYVQRSPQRVKSNEDKKVYIEELQSPKLRVQSDLDLILAITKSFILGEAPNQIHVNSEPSIDAPLLCLAVIDNLMKHNEDPVLQKFERVIIDHLITLNGKAVTEFGKLIEPFINEYIRLDDQIRNLATNHNHVSHDLETKVMCLVRASDTVSVAGRMTQLHHFCISHPDRVLCTLMRLLEVPGDELTGSHLDIWYHVLTGERAANVATIVDFGLFEFLCNLLFKVRPGLLFRFVQICQNISDKVKGLQAFMRSTYSMYFYEWALKILPGPEVSCQVQKAAVSKVQLMLSVNESKNVIPAMKILTHFCNWNACLKLLSRYSNDGQWHLQLFNMVVQSLLKENCLNQFCETVLSLKPKQMTLTSLLEMLVPRKDGIENFKLSDVLCTNTDQISIEKIRPLVLDLTSTAS